MVDEPLIIPPKDEDSPVTTLHHRHNTEAACLACVISELRQENERLKAENKALRRTEKGEVWYWQGDEDDHLESLSCPVLIDAGDLRGLLSNARQAWPTREICSECGRVSAVGFHVPDVIWRAAIPEDRRRDTFCIGCFALYADRKFVPWDKDIKFFPVSRRTHRQFFEAGEPKENP